MLRARCVNGVGQKIPTPRRSLPPRRQAGSHQSRQQPCRLQRGLSLCPQCRRTRTARMINSEGTSKFVPLPACCHDWSSKLGSTLAATTGPAGPSGAQLRSTTVSCMLKVLSVHTAADDVLVHGHGLAHAHIHGCCLLAEAAHRDLEPANSHAWIAPSTWPLLIGLSLWRRLRLAHAFC